MVKEKALKKLLVLTALVICSTDIFAQTTDRQWENLITAISAVESKHDPKAFNKNGNCAGILQITPVLVAESNNILKAKGLTKKYTLQDRFDKDKSIEMFHLIQGKYNPNKDISLAIRLWNAGPVALTKKNISEDYYRKVIAELKKLEEK